MLTGLGQQARGQGQRVNCPLPQTGVPPADRRSLPHPQASGGNVVSLSPSHEEGTPQGVLIRRQVKEGRESEGCSVIGQIGSESVDNILLRESGLTSARSFGTRESERGPANGSPVDWKQRPASAGAAPRPSIEWHQRPWRKLYRVVYQFS